MKSLAGNKTLGIGSVARLAGVTRTTVRFYERAQVVRPVARTAANYRLFGAEAVARIRFTRRAQDLGFTLREVKELLALRSRGRRSCRNVRATAIAKLADIKGRIRSLQRMNRALARLAEQCGNASATSCPLLEYLDNKL